MFTRMLDMNIFESIIVTTSLSKQLYYDLAASSYSTITSSACSAGDFVDILFGRGAERQAYHVFALSPNRLKREPL